MTSFHLPNDKTKGTKPPKICKNSSEFGRNTKLKEGSNNRIRTKPPFALNSTKIYQSHIHFSSQSPHLGQCWSNKNMRNIDAIWQTKTTKLSANMRFEGLKLRFNCAITISQHPPIISYTYSFHKIDYFIEIISTNSETSRTRHGHCTNEVGKVITSCTMNSPHSPNHHCQATSL